MAEKKKEHAVERMIPSDAADYLGERPNEPRYAKPLVLKDGTVVDLNEPGPFGPPAAKKRSLPRLKRRG